MGWQKRRSVAGLLWLTNLFWVEFHKTLQVIKKKYANKSTLNKHLDAWHQEPQM